MVSDVGPSPRARGAHHRHRLGDPGPGTIPACAGSTPRRQRKRQGRRDHPRVRGEHTFRREGIATALDHPRVRGEHTFRREGIATALDHPRVRGEHGTTNPDSPAHWGPSPRARGAHCSATVSALSGGTIPACAGSTGGGAWGGRANGDHPRVRGEHADMTERSYQGSGPSPRARGARDCQQLLSRLQGTIPACAGSTRSPAPTTRPSWDHPRVRGEHRPSRAAVRSSAGPSPRARGARLSRVIRHAQAGTIPVHAGSTSALSARTLCVRDHPRVRGEHTAPKGPAAVALGPSPRARGAQSTTCELTSGKQPNFQLPEKQTCATKTP